MGFFRRHAETIVVAMVTAFVTGAVPAIAIIANADRVNGFHANQLVRAGYKKNNASQVFNPSNYQTILSKSATAPVKGILLVWGNVDAEYHAGTSTTLQARFRIDGHSVGIPDTEQQIDNTGFYHSDSVALAAAVPV